MPKAKNKKKVLVPIRRSVSLKRATPSEKPKGKDLEHAVEQFQSESDGNKAHEKWKQIETSVFGVQFED